MVLILLLEIKNSVQINNFDVFYKFFQNLEYLFILSCFLYCCI